MEILGNFAELLKLPTRILAGITLATAALLYLPESARISLGLAGFVQQYRGWIGAVLLVALALLLTSTVADACPWVKRTCQDRRIQKARIARLNQLTQDEKAILRKYLGENTCTQTLQLSGIVKGLENADILYLAYTQAFENAAGANPYNLKPWAWAYLQKNPQTLDG